MRTRFLLQRANGCTWGRRRPLHMCKYERGCTNWEYFWVLIDAVLTACQSGCGSLLTRRATGQLLILGEIIGGAGLQLWTNATPFFNSLPPSTTTTFLSFSSNITTHPPLGIWRWVLLMSVNPDYQAEAHQLCPFSAQNTYSVDSSNTAIHADKHRQCMNKAQRQIKW